MPDLNSSIPLPCLPTITPGLAVFNSSSSWSAYLAINTSLIPAAPYFFCMKVRILKSSWRRIGYVLEVANHLERCSCVIPNLSPEGCMLCPISFVPPH